MRSIKPLPGAVHSSIRSSSILFDWTRVVEELIYNSLDAGATKVSIAVGVGTCYVKVVDNGSGITREGLVLLGERYTTSKFDQFADMEASSGSFGSRGEALASISDVSLLEIVTKAHGMPNGYRKVMKGCKCLYLGIDDDRLDVGTTVVVRDLFYNQPVRRKHMQSSPKKVLHSVKKCVLRIALVHSKVLFKVVDVESEDELLFTYPSSSPLPLLMSGFGIEGSSSLHELNVFDDMLNLSGYISGPCHTSSVKAFQYVYINSRFICKGPIHKMLNQLATMFIGSVLWKANITGLKNEKQSRCQAYPTYILNLTCPLSCYDLTFEPSKTSVEFKDWNVILTFIENAISQFWSENASYGDSLSHGDDMSGKYAMRKDVDNIILADEDLPKNYEIVKKRSRSQNRQASLGPSSSQSKILTEVCDHMSAWGDCRFSCQKSHRNALEFKERQTVGFVCQTNYPFQSCNGSFNQGRAMVNQGSCSHLGTPDRDVFSAEDIIWDNKFFATGRSNKHMDRILDSKWDDVSLNVDPDMSSKLVGHVLSANWFETGDNTEEVSEDFKKSFLQSCSSQRIMLRDGASSACDEGFEFQVDGVRNKRKRLDHDDRVGKGEFDDSNERFESMTPRQDKAASIWSSPRLSTLCDMHVDSNFLSRDSKKSFSIGESFAEENDLAPNAVAAILKCGSSHQFFSSAWSPVISDPFFGTKVQDKSFADEDVLERRRLKYEKSARCDHLMDGVDDCTFSFDTIPNSFTQENCLLSSCTNIFLDTKGDVCDFQEPSLGDVFFPKCSDPFTEWLYLDKRRKDNTYNCAVPSYCIPSSSYADEDKNPRFRRRYREKTYGYGKKRRHSAPPFYTGKKKFLALSDCSSMQARKANAQTFDDSLTSRGTNQLEHQQSLSDVYSLSSKLSSVDNSLFSTRPDMKRTRGMIEIKKCEVKKEDQHLHIYNVDSVEDFTSKENQDSLDYGVKWRNSIPQSASGDKSLNFHNQGSILDISSGILHLAISKSINKKCLEDAKVLLQVDQKFIPIVAGGTLAIIDQHAADERIRLEALRQKVLSGEMKTITYLDAEQELVLPEIGYQLMHNYAEQIQNWGWICNIYSQGGSSSFKKNLNLLHKQPTVAILLGVPCILGVNLTDVDLLEFLQQLADTDGSSTIPPSVLRVLNLKACRGAIMFGDTLLPSECSLIVQELKLTSLCFQCAHGRPTTAPLVNMKVLHKQITKLGFSGIGSNELWHGLRRHKLSLERAAQRLCSAGG